MNPTDRIKLTTPRSITSVAATSCGYQQWLNSVCHPRAADHPLSHCNRAYDVFYSASLDGGETFLSAVRVSSETSPRPLSTRETVAIETPAFSAICRMVGRCEVICAIAFH